MGFYHELSKYYKYIFPLNPATLEFLKVNLKSDKKVLDLACGSGEYTLGLSANGINVTGLDLDEAMIKKAKEKAIEEHLNSKFIVGNMLDLKNYFANDEFSSIFCIGNSLVHLNSADEIKSLLSSINDLLPTGGRLVIQIINYHRIFEKNLSCLPTIKNEDAGIEFLRNYIHNGDKVTFNTILKTPDNGEFVNNIDLLPIKPDELMSMLKSSGFNIIATYGSFKGDEFKPLESMPFIVVCEKNI